MDKLLVDMKAEVLAKMNQARKVAICVDIWSKKGLSASYLGITAQFLTPRNHKRNRATLAVRQLPSPHTGDNVEAVVEEVLGEWSIPREKVSAILTDNGSNMVKEWLTDLHEASDDSGKDESQEHPVPGDGGNSPSTTGSDNESGEEMDIDSHGKVDHEIHEFDDNKSEYDAAFILHTGLRCFSHSLQLVVRKFDTVKGLKRTLKIAHT